LKAIVDIEKSAPNALDQIAYFSMAETKIWMQEFVLGEAYMLAARVKERLMTIQSSGEQVLVNDDPRFNKRSACIYIRPS